MFSRAKAQLLVVEYQLCLADTKLWTEKWPQEQHVLPVTYQEVFKTQFNMSLTSLRCSNTI